MSDCTFKHNVKSVEVTAVQYCEAKGGCKQSYDVDITIEKFNGERHVYHCVSKIGEEAEPIQLSVGEDK